ncbi:S-adenosyl-L-homocysteine hydrolase family protein [Theileria parva strain Muguga]|uniref:S-adenosyl-L-homocysteine hydrolase, putative n=1 Tax=Theileria parva TaxID=5875 RepID=Q4N0H6_THEPA|nr:S-adenosyl-L-homocysteine hydrolase family protein [Theileria parva strain Muguga]EAN30895.1 S-adenosyl-L-homocysteine hydrolase family protein [Theileria parva strain Muguga]|eukprot:XP_763178.1 S-adenosyl-L-homocysteine hydrolase [Theileria parva strain Muguga]
MLELWNDLEPWSKTYYKGDDYGDTGIFVLDLCLKECPGLVNVMKNHAHLKPFKGVQISGCLHMTKETMTFARTLVELGAVVRWCSSNPNSSNNQAIFTADRMFKGKVTLFGYKGETIEEYFWCMYQSLNWPDTSMPLLLVDDGCCSYNMIHYGKRLEDMYREKGQLYDLSVLEPSDNDTRALLNFLNHLVTKKPDFFTNLVKRTVGLSEETTSGLTEMRKLYKSHGLLFPIYSTNDVVCKTKFDNNYGARYSSIDGMHRGVEGVLLGGRQVVVVGYGNTGKGVCMGFRGAGAIVKVCEADPICALQCVMDGYQVVLLEDVVETADIFVTATGCIEVIRLHHVRRMKDGAILGNIGQGDREILIHEILKDPHLEITEVRKNVHHYKFKDLNKGVIILSYGRLYNLGCANGHPSLVMSMSFTTQFFALSQLLENKDTFDNKIHKMPKKLDEMVARYHLEAIGAKLTVLTDRQCEFLGIDKDGPYKHEDYKY